MPDTWEVIVKPNGDIVTVYTDVLDLHEMGQTHVERASQVEFNEQAQAWNIQLEPHVRQGTTHILEVINYRNRSEAIQDEVNLLQRKLAKGEL